MPKIPTTEVYRCLGGTSQRPFPTKLDEGILMAAAFIADAHDSPSMAADILREYWLENCDIRHMAEFDVDRLRVLNEEHGIDLLV